MKSVLKTVAVVLCCCPLTQAQSVYMLVNPTSSTAYGNIQAAVTAAGTTGWVVIPSSYQSTASITGFSITSNVVTFTATNTLQAGQGVTISGLTAGSYMNGSNLIVLSTGLSSSQFEAAFTHANVGSTSASGLASCCNDTWTNPNGIHVYDQRPLSNSNTAVQIVNAANYGAICNGVNNDTTAIQAALNAMYAYSIPSGSTRVNIAVQLPQGTCRITTPLQVGIYGGLIGQGGSTFLYGDYANWVGSDYTMVEISYNGALPGGSTAVSRTFGDMQILGVGNTGIATAEAFSVINKANVYDPSDHALGQISFEHITVNNMDTAFDLQDIVYSQFHFVWVSQVRVGWNLNGDAVQIFFDHVYGQVGSWAGTSNHSATTGLMVQPNNKYSSGCATHSVYCAPQGIFFHDSSIVAFDNNVDIEQCVQCDIHDNTLDDGAGGAGGAGGSMQLGAYALGGGLWIHDNYIGTDKANTFLIYSTADGSGGGIDGLWITNNHFLDYVSPGTTIGIALVGAAPIYQVHIIGNTFYHLNEGIVSEQNVINSEIRGNTGNAISDFLINLAGAGSPDYTGTVIDGNTDTDSISVINEGSATNFVTGFNRSPLQVTGMLIATGSGCSIGGGSVGGICGPIPIYLPATYHFADGNYSVLGCSLIGATGEASATLVNNLTGSQFTIYEVSQTTSAVTGGVFKCQVQHP
jgi:hypothetical protein